MAYGWMPEAQKVNGVYRYSPGGENKVGVCSHTAGGFYETMLNPSFWNDSVQCSVHFAISREGQIAQIVNIFDRAWGQGRLNQVSWPPYPAMGYRNPNEYLISIEHEDAETVGGKTVFFGTWTPAQYAASLRVHDWCRKEIAYVKGVEMLQFQMDSLAGHYMFDAVNRANCPPSAWKTTYRPALYRDLTTQIKGANEMRIMTWNNVPYLVTAEGLFWIPEEGIVNDLTALLYGSAPAPISDRTWYWLNTAPGDATTFPNGGAGIHRKS